MFNNNGIGTYTEQRRLRACLGGPSRQHLSKHAGRVADFQDHPNRKPAVLTVTQPLTPGRPIPATPDRPQPTRRSTIPSCSPGESLNRRQPWNMGHLIADLSRTHTVIAPDLPGHGESDPPAGDYSLGAHACAMRDLLLSWFSLAGHSLGAASLCRRSISSPNASTG